MNAIDVLQQRVSAPRLGLPAPTQVQREAMLKAAMRAADHGLLRPWHFLFVEGEGLDQLGDLFVGAAKAKNEALTSTEIERLKEMPKRAPLICIVIARCQDHPKVPVIEQLISAGAAAQNLITAAFALNIGAVWRTGEMAYSAQVKQGLGLTGGEEIVGFIYLGTPLRPIGSPREMVLKDFFSAWPMK